MHNPHRYSHFPQYKNRNEMKKVKSFFPAIFHLLQPPLTFHTHTHCLYIHTHTHIYIHSYIAFLNSIERLYINFYYIIDPTDQLLTSLQRLWRMESSTSSEFDYLFKLLLIGDSGVGKSTLLLSFTSDTFEDLSPTIGVDFKVKYVTLGGKKLKLAIWDTAGQERFRTLTSSYYRGAQGIIMVYDVTRRETFTNLSDIWAKEIDLYSTNQDCIKMLVGNKVDKESERVVSKKEGIDFAREYGCLYIECSAKTRANVEQCFEELVLKILDTPSLLSDSTGTKRNIFKQKPPEPDESTSGCC